jgi:hypothetical protein
MLALDIETYREALALGAKLSGTGTAPEKSATEPLLDAEQLGAVMGLPPSWLEHAGRTGKIPCVEAGRWRRFRRSDVEAALAACKQ